MARLKQKIITIGEKGNEAKREAFSIDTQEGKWEGSKMEAPTTRLSEDPGIGEQKIIRRFDFQLPPQLKGSVIVSDDEILQHHKGKIISMLWKDGWEIDGDIKTLRKKNHFFIMIPCKAAIKNGMKQLILERPMNLNKDILNKNVK